MIYIPQSKNTKEFLILIILLPLSLTLVGQPSDYVGYWPFNGNAIDESINSNNGVVNGATMASDRFEQQNKALNFDGINDYIEINNIGGLDLTNELTLSAWIKGSSSSTSICGIITKPVIIPFGLGIDDGDRALFRVVSNETNFDVLVDTLTTDNTQWYHYVGIFKSSEYIKLFRNGIEIGQLNTGIPASLDVSTEDLWFGTRAHSSNVSTPQYFFQGSIDDLMIFDRALSVGEITQLMNPISNTSSQWVTHTNGQDIFYLNGNVGIGLENLDAKLVVDGAIRSEEIKVEVIEGADYVFDANYKLWTLQELKKFISINNHLPEIASAAEMQRNGIDLGQMNILLLKKVEELTLYQLQAMERIEELEEEIAKLKK